MKNGKVIEYSSDVLLKLYEEKYNKKDYLGALSILDRIYASFQIEKQTYRTYARLYYDMRIYTKSIKYWFLYLSIASEKDYARAYNGLGACFYKLGQKDLAGYYFDQQLKLTKNYLEFNEVASSYFNELSESEKDDYYIAYPYDKADFSKLIEKTHDLIINEEYEKAIEELSIIPETSKYYQDALTQISICEFLLEKTDNALLNIKKAVEIDDKNVITLCNAITMYNKLGKKLESSLFLKKLLVLDFEKSVDDIYKIIILFTEIKAYDKIEKYAKIYLKGNPYDLNVLFILGVNSFNLRKFNESLEYFKKGYIISKDYLFKFYIKLCEKAEYKREKGFKSTKLEYNIALPNSENEEVLKYLYTFVEKEFIPKKSLNKVKEYVDYCLSINSYKLQSYATIVAFKYPKNLRFETLQEFLISPNIYDGIKAGIICFLISEGYEGDVSIVVGNLFRKRRIYKPFIKSENDIYLTAYALCVSKVLPLHADTMKIKESVEKIVEILEKESMLNLDLKDARSLSFVVYEFSGLNKIKSRRELLKMFDANQIEVKKIEKVLFDNGLSIIKAD